jgi:hypothetical protein
MERSFVSEVFDQKYPALLGKRFSTFRAIFVWLESRKKKYYWIVETGCARITGNYLGDGQSTLLWDEFVNFYDGHVDSIDLSPESCRVAQNAVSLKTTVHCSDSCAWLKSRLPQISAASPGGHHLDLLYLDSFDLDLNNPHPSSMHHLKEFITVLPGLRTLNKNVLLAIDDNFGDIGKQRYVEDYLSKLEMKPTIREYQVIWTLDRPIGSIETDRDELLLKSR